jgi:hypothetical protein
LKKKNFFSSKSKIMFGKAGKDGANGAAPGLGGKEEGNRAVVAAKSCSIHGSSDIRPQMIDLTSTKEKFISYICLLAQLYFKILKIEDGQED